MSEIRTLFDLVITAAEHFPNGIFLSEKTADGIIDTTYPEFFAAALRVSTFLHNTFGRTVHAAIIGPTSFGYLAAYLGTMIGGNVGVPIDAQLAPSDICELIVRADAEVLFYDPRFKAAIPKIREVCPMIREFVELERNICSDYEPKISEDKPTESTLAVILFTSGTTGKAKGVMLSHGNFIDNVFCCDGEATPEDTLMTVLPIHHVYCFTCDILLSLRYGTHVCINDSLMKVAQNLKQFSPTIILLVPMIAATILKQIQAAARVNPDIPIRAIAQNVFGGRLKTIYSGGAYLNPELISAYENLGISIAQGYGMTECSPRITSGDLSRKSDGDVGTVVRGCEVKIEDGEIAVRSKSVMQGYYKDPQSTEETLRDGWLYTGDLGYVDEQGRLYITGRKKNLIILSNGENVSPEELENKLESVETAQEILVYAEDEILTAELFPGETYRGKSCEETVSEIKSKITEINKSLPSAKNIRRIRIRDTEFEKTTSRKIKRAQTSKGEIV